MAQDDSVTRAIGRLVTLQSGIEEDLKRSELFVSIRKRQFATVLELHETRKELAKANSAKIYERQMELNNLLGAGTVIKDQDPERYRELTSELHLEVLGDDEEDDGFVDFNKEDDDEPGEELSASVDQAHQDLDHDEDYEKQSDPVRDVGSGRRLRDSRSRSQVPQKKRKSTSKHDSAVRSFKRRRRGPDRTDTDWPADHRTGTRPGEELRPWVLKEKKELAKQKREAAKKKREEEQRRQSIKYFRKKLLRPGRAARETRRMLDSDDEAGGAAAGDENDNFEAKRLPFEEDDDEDEEDDEQEKNVFADLATPDELEAGRKTKREAIQKIKQAAAVDQLSSGDEIIVAREDTAVSKRGPAQQAIQQSQGADQEDDDSSLASLFGETPRERLSTSQREDVGTATNGASKVHVMVPAAGGVADARDAPRERKSLFDRFASLRKPSQQRDAQAPPPLRNNTTTPHHPDHRQPRNMAQPNTGLPSAAQDEHIQVGDNSGSPAPSNNTNSRRASKLPVAKPSRLPVPAFKTASPSTMLGATPGRTSNSFEAESDAEDDEDAVVDEDSKESDFEEAQPKRKAKKSSKKPTKKGGRRAYERRKPGTRCAECYRLHRRCTHTDPDTGTGASDDEEEGADEKYLAMKERKRKQEQFGASGAPPPKRTHYNTYGPDPEPTTYVRNAGIGQGLSFDLGSMIASNVLGNARARLSMEGGSKNSEQAERNEQLNEGERQEFDEANEEAQDDDERDQDEET